MGYKKEVIKGISWFGSLRFVTKAVGFLETIILARILLPAQFGAYGVALLTLGILEMLTETGVNIFLVQEKEIDSYIDSAWFVSIVRGIIISVVLLAATPLIANFFHSPESKILLYLISIVPFIRGFINPSIVKFQKELLFGKDFSYRLAILLVDTVVSITITYLTKNPIGIISGLLAGVIVECSLSFFIVTPRPKFLFHKEYATLLFHRGKWVTVAGIFDYLFENGDNIVVGRLLGTGALGIYQLAYALSVIPFGEVGKVFTYVTTPVLVRFSHDASRLQSAFLKSLLSVTLLLIPFVIILIIFPSIFVFILGHTWEQLAVILPVLAVLGLFRSLANASSALFLSVKKQNYVAVRTVVTIVGMFIVIIPLVKTFGIIGAGYAALIGTLVALPVLVYYIQKVLHEVSSANT